MSALHQHIEFVPADLRKGQTGQWMIVYKVKNPINGQLIRKRNRVPFLSNSREREKLARHIIKEINEKLYKGWNPFLEQKKVKNFAFLTDTIHLFLSFKEKELKKDMLRFDTLRSYKSHFKNFTRWLKKERKTELHTLNYTTELVQAFLDYSYYEKGNAPRTYNNYLGTFSTFALFLIKRGYLSVNPCDTIPKKKNGAKKRETISTAHLSKIITDFDTDLQEYNRVMGLTLYCLIRRTELTKLRVKDVRLSQRIIVVPEEISKNKMQGEVTIPKNFIHQLARHLQGANQEDYLFSKNNFKPGKISVPPKKISDVWATMRKKLQLPETYQFYSLKDTGITHYLNAGIAANKVKEQARHHDLRITEKYIQKHKTADEDLFRTDLSF